MDIQSELTERDTKDLQQALRYSFLPPNQMEEAKAVLTARGADIPAPMAEAEIEADFHQKRRKSTLRLFSTVLAVVVWLVYSYFDGLFEPGQGARLQQSVFYFGLALLMSLGYFGIRRH